MLEVFTLKDEKKTLRVAIYARVSTEDQTLAQQIKEVKDGLQNLNYKLVATFKDKQTGTGKKKRKEFEKMMLAASKAEFDLIAFRDLYRFSREGIQNTLGYLNKLESWGVKIKSIREPYLDTSNELMKSIMIAALSYFAAYEAQRNSDNTKAALAHKKRQGVKLGRPSKYLEHKQSIIHLTELGHSEIDIAKKLKISRTTLRTFKKKIEQETDTSSPRALIKVP